LKRLGTDLAQQESRLDELSALLEDGDFSRGKQLFFEKATCAICHRVSGQGGLYGPNLSTIAEIRGGRDLLESLLYPSASIVQGYHAMILETDAGEMLAGLLTRETADAVWLRGVDQAERRIDAGAIRSLRESPVSLMPQGLDQTLSHDELRDLLAFLQGLKRSSASAPDAPDR
jgi:putative heme-binding domain-containing protein